MGKNVSLLGRDAVESGGINGARATVTEIEWVPSFKYANGIKGGAALRVKYVIPGMDNWGDQHYSVGPSANYHVIDEGDAIQPVGKGKAGLNKNSNAHRFFVRLEQAAKEAGVAFERLVEGGNISALRTWFEEGHEVTLQNIAYADMDGNKREMPAIAELHPKSTQPSTPPITAAATELRARIQRAQRESHLMNEDEAAATPSGTGPHPSAKTGFGSAKTEPSKSKPDTTIAEKTTLAIDDLLTAADGSSIKFQDLPELILSGYRRDPDVRAMIQWAQRESNLASGPGWRYDSKRRVLR